MTRIPYSACTVEFGDRTSSSFVFSHCMVRVTGRLAGCVRVCVCAGGVGCCCWPMCTRFVQGGRTTGRRCSPAAHARGIVLCSRVESCVQTWGAFFMLALLLRVWYSHQMSHIVPPLSAPYVHRTCVLASLKLLFRTYKKRYTRVPLIGIIGKLTTQN